MVARELGRNLAISLTGMAVATAAHISNMWFTDPLAYAPRWHLYTRPFWVALTLLSPVAIGYFATRLVWLQTALAYCVFSATCNVWAWASITGHSYRASFWDGLGRMSVMGTLIGILLACAFAQLGVWLRHRRVKRPIAPLRH